MQKAAGCFNCAVSCVAVLQTVRSERYAPRRPEVMRSATRNDKQQRNKEEESGSSHGRCVSLRLAGADRPPHAVFLRPPHQCLRLLAFGIQNRLCLFVVGVVMLQSRDTHHLGSSTCCTFLTSLSTISSLSLPWALLHSSSKTFSYASRAAPRLLSPWLAAPTHGRRYMTPIGVPHTDAVMCAKYPEVSSNPIGIHCNAGNLLNKMENPQ